MRSVKLNLACGAICWGLLTPAVHAGEATIGSLVITQAWSRATPGGAPVAGGYLSIENKGSLPDRLLSGSTDAARTSALLHLPPTLGYALLLDRGVTIHIVAKRIGDDPAVPLRNYAKRKTTANNLISADINALAAGFSWKMSPLGPSWVHVRIAFETALR